MTGSRVDEVPRVARPKARPWWRRRYVLLVALLLAVASAYALAIGVLDHFADRRYRAAVAEADRLDPGWRADDLVAQLEPIPDAENSALRVLEVDKGLPAGWAKLSDEERLFPRNLHPEAPLAAKEVEALRDALALRGALGPRSEALARARALADWPRGRFPGARPDVRRWGFRPGANVAHVINPSPEEDAAERVARLLWLDAILRAQEGDADGALTSARALLNVGRSFGDSPSRHDQEERTRMAIIALGCLARALARGEATERSLAAMQAVLEDEAAHPGLLTALRGHRAAFDGLLSQVHSGAVGRDAIPVWSNVPMMYSFIISRRDLRDIQTRLLHQLTALVEEVKSPAPDRDKRLKDFELACYQDLDNRSGWTRMRDYVWETLLSDALWVARFAETDQARLRATIAALAAERFRLARGRWPDSLDELVPSLLARVPDDPFARGPIRLRRLKDGLFVYTVGWDGKDDGGAYDPRDWIGRGGDLGVRLWDPDHRPPKPADATSPAEGEPGP
jgi:hypothetical protein